MDAITFSLRFIANILFLLLVQADSILLSTPLINHHFEQSQSYIYTAASVDNPQANYQLYLQTKDKYWLKKAASLNHRQSVFQWYLIQHENQHISQNVWLQQAVKLGHEQAILIKLNRLVEDKKWALAKAFQQQYRDALDTLEDNLNTEDDLSVQYQNIKSMLSVSTSSDENNPVLFSNQTPVINIKNQVSQPKIELQCAVTIQTVVESQSLLNKAKQFEAAFVNSKLSGLSICFLPAQPLPELQVVCDSDIYNRIECDLNQLAQSLLKKVSINPVTYTHVLVIVDQGDANTRGGLMYLDKQDSDQVFIHELAHWLGYIDEYQIKPNQQAQLCNVAKPKWIGPNLFVASKKLNKNQVEQIASQDLYFANTCVDTDFQAYKKYEEPSFMEFLNLPLTQEYAEGIKQNVDYSTILPVAMNFWVDYLSKGNAFVESSLNKNNLKNPKQFMEEQYLIWVKIAAAQRFTPAMTLLAQHYISINAYSDAYTALLEAAEMNNTNAQLLLGHGYIEGRWLPQDVVKSGYWYKQAAKQNDPYGLYFYAKCHEMGWGCELSFEKAIGYYQQAKELGNKLAIKRLNTLAFK